jgi:hypothetical protein
MTIPRHSAVFAAGFSLQDQLDNPLLKPKFILDEFFIRQSFSHFDASFFEGWSLASRIRQPGRLSLPAAARR